MSSPPVSANDACGTSLQNGGKTTLENRTAPGENITPYKALQNFTTERWKHKTKIRAAPGKNITI